MQQLSTLKTGKTFSLRELYACEVRVERRRLMPRRGRGDAGRGDEKSCWLVGKVDDVLFHPTELRVLGISIKPAPSSLTLLQRLLLGRPAKQRFARLDELNVSDDGAFVIKRKVARRGKQETAVIEEAATPAITWADTVVFYGMPLYTDEGKRLGRLSDARFNPATGKLHGVELSAGATADVSLGKRVIPAEQVLGFRQAETEDEPHCIVVKQEAAECAHEGGLAARAGVVAAVAGSVAGKLRGKTGKVAAKATRKVSKGVAKFFIRKA